MELKNAIELQDTPTALGPLHAKFTDQWFTLLNVERIEFSHFLILYFWIDKFMM